MPSVQYEAVTIQGVGLRWCPRQDCNTQHYLWSDGSEECAECAVPVRRPAAQLPKDDPTFLALHPTTPPKGWTVNWVGVTIHAAWMSSCGIWYGLYRLGRFLLGVRG